MQITCQQQYLDEYQLGKSRPWGQRQDQDTVWEMRRRAGRNSYTDPPHAKEGDPCAGSSCDFQKKPKLLQGGFGLGPHAFLCRCPCPLTLPKGMGYTKKRLSSSLRKRGCSFSFTMKMISAGIMLGPWAGKPRGDRVLLLL